MILDLENQSLLQMAEIDPFADISSLPLPIALNNIEMTAQLPNHPQEYSRELELANYPTRYLFDQLLAQNQQLPLTILNQNNKKKRKKAAKRAEQANFNQLSAKAETISSEVQKNKRIAKEKKVGIWQCKSMVALPKREVQVDNEQRWVGLRRRKAKIQQSAKQQKEIQPTRKKRKYRKTSKIESTSSLSGSTLPKAASSICLLKEQFEDYLNLQ